MLRKGGFKAPIIMLTGHDTESDTIPGLEAGANDYVAKLFKFAAEVAGAHHPRVPCASTSRPRTRSSPSAATPSVLLQAFGRGEKGGKVRL